VWQNNKSKHEEGEEQDISDIRRDHIKVNDF
jgi:hypothetical protein